MFAGKSQTPMKLTEQSHQPKSANMEFHLTFKIKINYR